MTGQSCLAKWRSCCIKATFFRSRRCISFVSNTCWPLCTLVARAPYTSACIHLIWNCRTYFRCDPAQGYQESQLRAQKLPKVLKTHIALAGPAGSQDKWQRCRNTSKASEFVGFHRALHVPNIVDPTPLETGPVSLKEEEEGASNAAPLHGKVVAGDCRLRVSPLQKQENV